MLFRAINLLSQPKLARAYTVAACHCGNKRANKEMNSAEKKKPESGAGEQAPTPQSNQFECNICLDTASDAVISYCGHLFCWPCLLTWLETRPRRQTCPVCKAGISREKVVPLYGRGSATTTDPRLKIPPRPQAQRSEPENNQREFPGFNFGDGSIQMSFGIGAFPFGYLGAMFNGTDGRPPPPPGSPYNAENVHISRAFLWIGIALTIWMVLFT